MQYRMTQKILGDLYIINVLKHNFSYLCCVGQVVAEEGAYI